MAEGWISLHRKFIDWEWYDDNNTMKLFIHLLLKANHKKKNWKGIIINKGQILTGRKQLSFETKLSEQQIRTSLNKLKSTNEITIKSTNLYSLVSITNWNKYQGVNQRITNEQPTDNQQVTTTNNVNNDNNVNKYSDEIKNFTEGIIKYFPVSSIPKKLDEWFEITEKLNRIENYNLIDIEIIVKRFRADDFWQNNFMSYKKLRSKNKEGIKYIDYFANIIKNQNNGSYQKKHSKSNATPEGILNIIKQFPDS